MVSKLGMAGMLAGLAAAGSLASATHAQTGSGQLTWSGARAYVGVCKVGITCGQPNGIAFLSQKQSIDTDTDFNGASVSPQDYAALTNGVYFGGAWSSAEAGEGPLGLPTLHALAASGNVGVGWQSNPTIGVDVAMVQAVQGYTNKSAGNLVIPLNAFRGTVDYHVSGAPGTISAGLAITTSAILDPAIAALWSASGTASQFGQFTAGCGTAGALAIGSPAAVSSSPSPSTRFLSVEATSCTGSDTLILAPDETFYVWSRLAVLHTAVGVTDAANTFVVDIAPEYQELVQQTLAPSLALASGANLDIDLGAVPEPGSWVLMLTGFFLTGAAIRRQRRVALA